MFDKKSNERDVTKQNKTLTISVRCDPDTTHTHTPAPAFSLLPPSLFNLNLALWLSCHNTLIDCARTAIGFADIVGPSVQQVIWVYFLSEISSGNSTEVNEREKNTIQCQISKPNPLCTKWSPNSLFDFFSSNFHTKLHLCTMFQIQPSIAYVKRSCDLRSFWKYIHKHLFVLSLSLSFGWCKNGSSWEKKN